MSRPFVHEIKFNVRWLISNRRHPVSSPKLLLFKSHSYQHNSAPSSDKLIIELLLAWLLVPLCIAIEDYSLGYIHLAPRCRSFLQTPPISHQQPAIAPTRMNRRRPLLRTICLKDRKSRTVCTVISLVDPWQFNWQPQICHPKLPGRKSKHARKSWTNKSEFSRMAMMETSLSWIMKNVAEMLFRTVTCLVYAMQWIFLVAISYV